jgi:hypothetical protein
MRSAEAPRLVAYERVSTARLGRSGLGLAAQRAAIDRHAAETGADVLDRFTEVESGRRTNRPELAAALHLARLTGATLVIAKLDRLSRNAAFLTTLRDAGVRFTACDLPHANDLTVGTMALVAEQERQAISRRTREALAAAKARGTKLGNPNGASALRRAGKGGTALHATVRPRRHPHRRPHHPPRHRQRTHRQRHQDKARRQMERVQRRKPAGADRGLDRLGRATDIRNPETLDRCNAPVVQECCVTAIFHLGVVM